MTGRLLLKKTIYILSTLAVFMFFPVVNIFAEDTSSQNDETGVVYTALLGSLSDTSGDGTKENPYNRFEDAVANVPDGGTIYILSSQYAFLNIQDDDMPFVIDKNVTIKPEPGADKAVLTSRSAGIILGADVTIENIEIGEAYKYHAQIFANGHSLTLKNVYRSSSCRLIDIVAGGLYDTSGNPIGPETGKNAQITIQGDVELGNIYAGSMNGVYDGDTSICIKETSGSIGNVYASGAKEAVVDRDNFFDLEEPPAPVADAEAYPVSGKVDVTLKQTSVTMVEGAGAAKGTGVVFGTQYYNSNLTLNNISSLGVESGTLQPKELTMWAADKLDISVSEGATLNLSGLENMEINDFSGGGTLVLGENAVLRINGNFTGTTAFETSGGYNGHSGLAVENHIYIYAKPETQGTFTFEPLSSQSGFTFVKQETGAWMIVPGNDISIGYFSDSDRMGDVSINWDTINEDNPEPEGAVAQPNPGYHFVNWLDEEDNVVSNALHFIPEKTDEGYVEAIYYAVFAANNYQVQFLANGGTNGTMLPQKFTYGELQQLSTNTYTKEDCTFAGWNTKADGNGTAYSDKATVKSLTTENGGVVTLYAQWKGASEQPNTTEEQTTTQEEPTTEEPTTTQEQTTTEKPTTTQKVATTEKPTTTQEKTTTEKDEKAYTIKYVLNRGTNALTNPASYTSSTSTIKLKNPVRKGYTFAGWYSNSSYKTKVTKIPKGSKGNKTLYAKWTKVSVAKTAALTVTNVNGKKLKIKYAGVKGAKGYEIQYSTGKSFKKAKSVSTQKKIYTTPALKKNKTYYVRIRAYKYDSTGNKVYGNWSKVKHKKITK